MDIEYLRLYAHWVFCIGDRCGSNCRGKKVGKECRMPTYFLIDQNFAKTFCEKADAFESIDNHVIENAPF